MDQDYLAINPSNVVDNIITWDGNPQTWAPPVGYTMLVKATTPALIWGKDKSVTPAIWVLQKVIGVGEVGFTWDGTVVITNQPEPQPPTPSENQPTTSGTMPA